MEIDARKILVWYDCKIYRVRLLACMLIYLQRLLPATTRARTQLSSSRQPRKQCLLLDRPFPSLRFVLLVEFSSKLPPLTGCVCVFAQPSSLPKSAQPKIDKFTTLVTAAESAVDAAVQGAHGEITAFIADGVWSAFTFWITRVRHCLHFCSLCADCGTPDVLHYSSKAQRGGGQP